MRNGLLSASTTAVQIQLSPLTGLPSHSSVMPLPLRASATAGPTALPLSFTDANTDTTITPPTATLPPSDFAPRHLPHRWQRVVSVGHAIVFAIIGSALFAYTLSAILLQQSSCTHEVGAVVWIRVYPQIFFANGLFSATSCNFASISHLNLDHSDLAVIPHSLVSFVALASLSLANNQIGDLSPLLNVPSLLVLDASDNPIQTLPVALADLWSSHISPEFALTLNNTPVSLSLDWSNVGFNGSSLPTVVGQLLSLRSLNLRNNNLTAVPLVLMKLRNLQVLDVSHNQLTALPGNLVAAMPNITHLLVSHNRIQLLGPIVEPEATSDNKFSAWANLTVLDLSDNQLQAVPAELSRLQQNVDLRLRGNPVEAIVIVGESVTVSFARFISLAYFLFCATASSPRVLSASRFVLLADYGSWAVLSA